MSEDRYLRLPNLVGEPVFGPVPWLWVLVMRASLAYRYDTQVEVVPLVQTTDEIRERARSVEEFLPQIDQN